MKLNFERFSNYFQINITNNDRSFRYWWVLPDGALHVSACRDSTHGNPVSLNQMLEHPPLQVQTSLELLLLNSSQILRQDYFPLQKTSSNDYNTSLLQNASSTTNKILVLPPTVETTLTTTINAITKKIVLFILA